MKTRELRAAVWIRGRYLAFSLGKRKFKTESSLTRDGRKASREIDALRLEFERRNSRENRLHSPF